MYDVTKIGERGLVISWQNYARHDIRELNFVWRHLWHWVQSFDLTTSSLEILRRENWYLISRPLQWIKQGIWRNAQYSSHVHKSGIMIIFYFDARASFEKTKFEILFNKWFILFARLAICRSEYCTPDNQNHLNTGHISVWYSNGIWILKLDRYSDHST